jgi:hypothetical protein
MKKSFVPQDKAALVAWFSNFSKKLAKYKSKYLIADDEVDDIAMASATLNYWSEVINLTQEYSQSLTAFRRELLYGVEGGSVVTLLPAQPNLDTAPAVIPPDIVGRAAAIGKRIKAHKDFTEADGQDLGLFGEEIVLSEGKPSFKIVSSAGGHPELAWRKYNYAGIQVYARYEDTEQWQWIGTGISPNFVDEHPLPPAGKSAIWHYRIIYVDKNMRQMGDFSDIVSITVTGMV